MSEKKKFKVLVFSTKILIIPAIFIAGNQISRKRTRLESNLVRNW